MSIFPPANCYYVAIVHDMEQGIYFLYPQKDTRYIHSPILKRNLIYTHRKQKYKPCFNMTDA